MLIISYLHSYSFNHSHFLALQIMNRMTEDEMVGRHHRLSGQEFEQAQGDSEVKDMVAWHAAFHGVTASDTTEQLNTNNISSALGRVSWSNPGA